MKRVLFLCSANYYRSRYAEHYFNYLAAQAGLPHRAESRGVLVGNWGNIGPISRATVERLREHGISVEGIDREPIQVAEADLAAADVTVAVKEVEHRPVLAELHPNYVDRVTYWQIDDLDCAVPDVAFPKLEQAVQDLLKGLKD